MKFPPGYCALKPDVGWTIKRKRLAASDPTLRSKKEVAFRSGIDSETLTRIENGKQRPSKRTLESLMAVLEFKWDEIAKKGRNPKGDPPNLLDNLADLCSALRAGRLKDKATLEDVSQKTGIPVSQLSRIECQLFGRSKLLEIDRPDGVLKPDKDTRYRFKHPELRRLVKLAGFDDTYGFTRYRTGS